MSIIKKLKDNIKIENIASTESVIYSGSPSINTSVCISILNDIEKTIISDETILYNNYDEVYNLRSLSSNKNSYFVYNRGFYFYDFCNLNQKIFYISNFSSTNLFGNIFTTIICINKIVNNSEKNNIFFNDIFNDKENKYIKVLFSNYFKFLMNNVDMNDLYSFNRKKIDYNFVEMNIMILKTDIKLNFILLFLIRFYSDFDDDILIRTYLYFYDNIIKLFINSNLTKESINEYFNSDLIKFDNFNDIINTWFLYIDNTQNLIYLSIICNIFVNFTDNEILSNEKNKNKILNKYFDYEKFKNKLLSFGKML